MKNFLITGGLGKTTQPLIELLVDNYSITVLDIAQYVPKDFSYAKNVRIINGDICDIDFLRKTMFNIDIVIHLAVNVIDTENHRLSFDVNVFGTFNVLKAAHETGVEKIVMASSAPVHLDNGLCSPGEDFTYDLTKILQEDIASNFSKTFLMDIMVLRLGHIVDGIKKTDFNGTPLSELEYCKSGWVCRYDVARAFKKAVEINFTGYHLLHIIGSYQAKERFDIASSKKIIGFECLEQFKSY